MRTHHVGLKYLSHRQISDSEEQTSNTVQVAAAVARAAWESGVSQLPGPPDDWLEYIADLMWWPECEEKAQDWLKQVRG